MDELDLYFRRELGVRLGPVTLAEVRSVAGAESAEGALAEVRGADLTTGAAKTVCVVLADLPI